MKNLCQSPFIFLILSFFGGISSVMASHPLPNGYLDEAEVPQPEELVDGPADAFPPLPVIEVTPFEVITVISREDLDPSDEYAGLPFPENENEILRIGQAAGAEGENVGEVEVYQVGNIRMNAILCTDAAGRTFLLQRTGNTSYNKIYFEHVD